MNRRLIAALLALAMGFGGATLAAWRPTTLTSGGLSAGGGGSAGGNYTVTGSAGAWDAGRRTGAGYTLEGGILIVPEETPAPAPRQEIYLPQTQR